MKRIVFHNKSNVGEFIIFDVDDMKETTNEIAYKMLEEYLRDNNINNKVKDYKLERNNLWNQY